MYGLRRVAVASGDNLCPSVGHIFPLIAQIYTDILGFCANPCSSVVGIISHGEISLCGYVLTTECHGNARKHETYYILALLAEISTI